MPPRDFINGEGWRIHLTLPQTTEDPRTMAIASYCQENSIPHKIGQGRSPSFGGVGAGKGITIHTRTRQRLDKVATDIENLTVEERPIDLAFPTGEIPLHNTPITASGRIWARFRTEDRETFQDSGFHGLPLLNQESAPLFNQTLSENDSCRLYRPVIRRTYLALEELFGTDFTGVAAGITPAWAEIFLSDSPEAIRQFNQLHTAALRAAEAEEARESSRLNGFGKSMRALTNRYFASESSLAR